MDNNNNMCSFEKLLQDAGFEKISDEYRNVRKIKKKKKL